MYACLFCVRTHVGSKSSVGDYDLDNDVGSEKPLQITLVYIDYFFNYVRKIFSVWRCASTTVSSTLVINPYPKSVPACMLAYWPYRFLILQSGKYG